MSWIYCCAAFAIRGQIAAGSSQASAQLPANVATTTDLENLKKELTNIVRSEIAVAKHDILDGISNIAVYVRYIWLIYLNNVRYSLKVLVDYLKSLMISVALN